MYVSDNDTLSATVPLLTISSASGAYKIAIISAGLIPAVSNQVDCGFLACPEFRVDCRALSEVRGESTSTIKALFDQLVGLLSSNVRTFHRQLNHCARSSAKETMLRYTTTDPSTVDIDAPYLVRPIGKFTNDMRHLSIFAFKQFFTDENMIGERALSLYQSDEYIAPRGAGAWFRDIVAVTITESPQLDPWHIPINAAPALTLTLTSNAIESAR